MGHLSFPNCFVLLLAEWLLLPVVVYNGWKRAWTWRDAFLGELRASHLFLFISLWLWAAAINIHINFILQNLGQSTNLVTDVTIHFPFSFVFLLKPNVYLVQICIICRTDWDYSQSAPLFIVISLTAPFLFKVFHLVQCKKLVVTY